MHPNKQLLINFFTAIQNNNVDALSDCYHDELHYSDDILDDLYGDDARAMLNWFVSTREQARMLGFRILDVTDRRGRARWEIEYRSARSGRLINREIESEFQFEDGKIIYHHDYFDWGRWARRTFGPYGTHVSWAPTRDRVRRKVRKAIDEYTHNWSYGIDINVNGKEIRIVTGKRK